MERPRSSYLAGLHAMQDDFATAQATLSSAKDLLDTLGAPMTASATSPPPSSRCSPAIP